MHLMIELQKNIYVVKNIISNKSIKKILKYLDGLEESDWIDKNEPGFWKDKNHFPKKSIKDIDILNKKSECLFDNFLSFQEFYPLSRMKSGMSGLEPHCDAGGDNRIQYGLIFYLNDNYVGGEIYYPEINFEYKPFSGDLLIHSGDILHGVKEVISGTRYMLTAFIHGDDTRKAIIK